MPELFLDKKAVIAQLARSPHGALKDYVPVASLAAAQDPEFYGHLIAWTHQKSAIRDAKVALPVIALATPSAKAIDVDLSTQLRDNAAAHLADLRPKQFLQAVQFARQVNAPHRLVKRLITRYLRDLEADRREWENTALRHREVLRTLYGFYHVAPGGRRGSEYDVALMKRDATKGKFAIVRTLATLPGPAIAQVIKQNGISFLVARGALGARAKETDVLMALMSVMTPTELVTNARYLKRLGVLEVPELRATLTDAIAKAGKKGRKPAGAVLKTTKAATVLEDEGDAASGKLATKLRVLQEKQLDHLKTIEGDWLISGDCSYSMNVGIDVARKLTALLARLVKGKVHLIFSNTEPRYFDATGKSYEEILAATKNVRAEGGTILGVGLDYLVSRKLSVDGIAIVSDGGQNGGKPPYFSQAYEKYRKVLGNEPTVYFYKLQGDPDELTPELARTGIVHTSFDLRAVQHKIDGYSLPDLVRTMRVDRYSLVDEIMDTPLRSIDEVLKQTVGMEVLCGPRGTRTATAPAV